jgi:tRNA threonylcarbamoyladenosine biosynthesis protein TsaE
MYTYNLQNIFMTTHISHSLDETAHIASRWLDSILNRERSQQFPAAAVIGLSGNLGSGKTAFVKLVAKELGITEDVTSPTFVIMKKYPIADSTEQTGGTRTFPWKNLVHIDAYRLETGEQARVLNFEHLISDKENLIVIEWPEHIEHAIKSVAGYSQLSFSIPENDPNSRTITEE